jgi:hypothetical protein
MGNVGDVDYADVPSARKNAATDDACATLRLFLPREQKQKATGPCELRALLRDEPSSHARGVAEGTSHGTTGPCDPTTPAMLGR